MRWEYRVVKADEYISSNRHTQLDRLGQQGWELTAITDEQHGLTWDRYFYMKRPLPPLPGDSDG